MQLLHSTMKQSLLEQGWHTLEGKKEAWKREKSCTQSGRRRNRAVKGPMRNDEDLQGSVGGEFGSPAMEKVDGQLNGQNSNADTQVLSPVVLVIIHQ